MQQLTSLTQITDLVSFSRIGRKLAPCTFKIIGQPKDVKKFPIFVEFQEDKMNSGGKRIMRLSVCVPVFDPSQKYSEHLLQLVNSIKAQTMKPDEVVITANHNLEYLDDLKSGKRKFDFTSWRLLNFSKWTEKNMSVNQVIQKG